MITLEKNGLRKRVSTGYSFKSLFFGVFYPIARGDMKGVINQVLLVVLTGGLCWLIIPFNYNRRYLKRLIEDGYKPSNDKANKYLKRKLKYKG